MTTWLQRMEQDASLRAFVAARIGQAVVELAALRVEHQRDLEAIEHLRAENSALRSQIDGKKQREKR